MLPMWIALALIIVTCILLYVFQTNSESFSEPMESGSNKRDVPGKTVWLLWLQGWDRAPWLSRQVAESWKRNNPEWNIELLCEANLSDYVDIDYLHDGMTSQAKSDVIRLHLMADHGGVWADATLPCLVPLDEWVYDAVEPVGYWMYHGRDRGKGPASWFMVSMKGSYIAETWKTACVGYWKGRKETGDYFWMDGLFSELLETNDRFAKEWFKVPYLWADSPGESHMLAGRTLGNDAELKQLLETRPPYVIKLDKRVNENNVHGTNSEVALETALTQKHAPYPLHSMKQLDEGNDLIFWSDKVIVVSDCGHAKDLLEIERIGKNKQAPVVVYDKCHFGKRCPSGVYCRPLRNVGREQATFAFFTAKYYDRLPKHVFFVPNPVSKYNRLARLESLLENDDSGDGCGDTLGRQADVAIDEWEGNKLRFARARPFKSWYEIFIGSWKPDAKGPCWNGIMHTTRERIWKNPRQLYVNLCIEAEYGGNHGETGHYLERAMASVF